MTVRDARRARGLFEQRYGIAAVPLLREIERRVIGGDWGANGYTTMAQADQLATGLSLSPTDRLLDLGTGRGWPGLYLAARSGCRVILADLPLRGYGWPPPAPRQKASRPGPAPRPAACPTRMNPRTDRNREEVMGGCNNNRRCPQRPWQPKPSARLTQCLAG